MRAAALGGILLVTLAVGACASAEEDRLERPRIASASVVTCDLQTNDVFLPPGGEQIAAALRSAPLPEGMHLSTRTIVERTDADPTRLETHVRLCAEEPLTRDELIVAGTALAVAIGQSEVSDLVQQVSVRAWHPDASGTLVDAEEPVRTDFRAHDWTPGDPPDPSRWE